MALERNKSCWEANLLPKCAWHSVYLIKHWLAALPRFLMHMYKQLSFCLVSTSWRLIFHLKQDHVFLMSHPRRSVVWGTSGLSFEPETGGQRSIMECWKWEPFRELCVRLCSSEGTSGQVMPTCVQWERAVWSELGGVHLGVLQALSSGFVSALTGCCYAVLQVKNYCCSILSSHFGLPVGREQTPQSVELHFALWTVLKWRGRERISSCVLYKFNYAVWHKNRFACVFHQLPFLVRR